MPPPALVVVKIWFCGFFFFEPTIHLFAFERKRECIRDDWFVFDAALVAVAVMETWRSNRLPACSRSRAKRVFCFLVGF